MCYRCGVCSAKVGPRVPLQQHQIKRVWRDVLGNRRQDIVREIPVCVVCGGLLRAGLSLAQVKRQEGKLLGVPAQGGQRAGNPQLQVTQGKKGVLHRVDWRQEAPIPAVPEEIVQAEVARIVQEVADEQIDLVPLLPVRQVFPSLAGKKKHKSG